jgi:hypothetical protein
MTASDRFTKLKEQVEEAERRVNEAGSQDKAQLQAKVDEARKNADDLAAELHAKTRQASQAEVITGKRSGVTGTSTSSGFESASTPRRPRTTRRSPKKMPSGPRPTRSTPSTSLPPRSRRPNTRCSTRCSQGRTRTS